MGVLGDIYPGDWGHCSVYCSSASCGAFICDDQSQFDRIWLSDDSLQPNDYRLISRLGNSIFRSNWYRSCTSDNKTSQRSNSKKLSKPQYDRTSKIFKMACNHTHIHYSIRRPDHIFGKTNCPRVFHNSLSNSRVCPYTMVCSYHCRAIVWRDFLQRIPLQRISTFFKNWRKRCCPVNLPILDRNTLTIRLLRARPDIHPRTHLWICTP